MSIRPYLTIRQIDPPGPSVTFLMGDGFAKPSSDGGWEVVSRPRRLGVVNWAGYAPLTMDLPLIADEFAAGASIEPTMALLDSMQRRAQGPRAEPPVVRIGGIPTMHQNLTWVIQNIDYGAEERRASDGQRTRQLLTVSLLQYSAPNVTVARAPSPAKVVAAKASSGATHATARTYTVKAGDTLSGIAARVLHNASRWGEIAKLNGIRDPKSIRVGQVLRLP